MEVSPVPSPFPGTNLAPGSLFSWFEPFPYAPGLLNGQGPWTVGPDDSLHVQSAGNIVNTQVIDAQEDSRALGVLAGLTFTADWRMSYNFTVPTLHQRYTEVILGTDDGVHDFALYYDHDASELIVTTGTNPGIDLSPVVIAAGPHQIDVIVQGGLTTVRLDGVDVATNDPSVPFTPVSGTDVTLYIDANGTAGRAAIAHSLFVQQP